MDEKAIPLISRVNTQKDEIINKSTLQSKSQKLSTLIKRIPVPRDSGKFPQIKLILLLVAIQRFALYSVLNFQLTVTKTGLLGNDCVLDNWTGQEDSIITYVCSFLFAPIAGLLADWKFGRHRVFSFGLMMQFIGYTALGVIFSNQIFINTTNCGVFYAAYYLSLLCVVIGCSSFNAVIIPYGVDQMREASVITTIPSFFHWYYFSINLGDLLAFGGVEQQSHKLIDKLLAINNVFLAVFSSFVAVLLYKISSSFGWLGPSPPQGNPLGKIYSVVKNAIGNKINKHKQIDIYQRKTSLLDFAKHSNGGKFSFEQVEDVKTFFSMLLVLMALSWYYSGDYLDVNLYLLQANGFIFKYTSPVPIIISKIGSITAMITIIILEYTTLGRKLYRVLPRILHRFLIGFPLAILSILFATILDYAHKAPCIAASLVSLHSNASSGIPTLTDGNDYLVYLQIFQYGILNLSEVLVTVGSIEWVYAQSPEYLRALTYGIFESVIGFGTSIPFIFNLFVSHLTCQDTDSGMGCPNCWIYKHNCIEKRYCSSTEYYLTVILFVSVLSLMIFLLISCWYTPRTRQRVRGFQSFSQTTGRYVHRDAR